MANNVQFSLANLDPDSLKASLVAYLQSKPQFAGFNYQGANWNAVLDVLGRNTFLKSFMYNMLFNESFLYSAQLRDSVVGRAADFSYVPRSMTSSSTMLNLFLATSGINNFEIPSGTRFSGMNSNSSFVFTTSDPLYATSSNGNYTFSNVAIYEGTYMTDVFTVNNSNTNQFYTLSNPTIDTTSLALMVSENFGASFTPYQLADNLYYLDGSSNVFFLQATNNNQYQFQFGDGILGYQPQSGAIIQANYRVTLGDAADGVSSFVLLDNLGSFNGGTVSNVVITPLGPSGGGSQPEDIESIRFNAPRHFQTQGAGVTSQDFENLIRENFPQVGDVNVFGGNINGNTVQYGTVLVSCVSQNGNPLTQATKDEIIEFLDDKTLIHPATIMIDADSLYVDVAANVHVNFGLTNNSIQYYKTGIANVISQFSNTNLETYTSVFRSSVLETNITTFDNTAIISTEVDLTLKRLIPIVLNTNTNLSFSFNNPINNLNSDYFVKNGLTNYITDTVNGNSNGTLYNIYLNTSNNVIQSVPVGSVNYNTGAVQIANLCISAYLNNSSEFYIYAEPLKQDIYPSNNDIVLIDTVNGISVNVVSN